MLGMVLLIHLFFLFLGFGFELRPFFFSFLALFVVCWMMRIWGVHVEGGFLLLCGFCKSEKRHGGF